MQKPGTLYRRGRERPWHLPPVTYWIYHDVTSTAVVGYQSNLPPPGASQGSGEGYAQGVVRGASPGEKKTIRIFGQQGTF